MPNTHKCPSVEQLKQLAVGLLPDPPASSLEEHLLECDACVQQTAQLQQADTLLSAIKQAGQAQTEQSPEEMARLERLMTSLSGLRGQKDDSTTLVLPQGSSEMVSLADKVTRELTAVWGAPENNDELGRIGGYRILKVLGVGGMGGVFLAEDMQLQRRVALKLMRPRAESAPGAAERFLREARAAAALRHDHIVTIYQVGEAAGVPFLAMEYLEGESLDDRLQRESSLPVTDVLRIGREIAEGLAAAHAKGLIHRDIKPANVWLEGAEGQGLRGEGDDNNEATAVALAPQRSALSHARVKLLDFGLARAVSDTENLTQSGMILGTPAYMAPEQARGEPVDARADLFSLGCVLYRMLTGKSAFSGKSVLATLTSLATHEPPAPQMLRAEVPSELSDLVMQLLAKNRDDRPASAREVSRRMGTLARPELATNEKKTGRSAHPPKRVALAVFGLAAMVLFGVILVKIKMKDGKETEVTINVPGEVSSVATTVSDGAGAKAVSKNGVDANAAKFITLAALDPEKIPESERFDWQPEELVAVMGEHRLRHWGGVAQVRFHPSGEFFVTVSVSAALTLTKSLNSPLGGFAENVAQSISVLGFEFSQDGKWMYSGNRIYSVNMTDAANPRIELAHTLTTDKDVNHSDVVIHDNRWLILATDAPGELLVWDVAAQPPRQIKSVKYETKQRMMNLTLSTDGRRLAGGEAFYGPVRVWDIDWTNDDDPAFALRDQQVPGIRPEMSPHDSLMAAGGAHDLWDVSQTPFQLRQQIDGGDVVAFSPDGKYLAVAGAGGLGVRLYAQTDAGWAKRHALSDGMGNVMSLAWSPDESTLVAGGQFGGVHVWDMSVDPPKLRNPTRPAGNVRQIAISPDGRSMLANGADIMTTAWNLDGAVPSRRDWETYGDGFLGLSSYSHDSQLANFVNGSPCNMATQPPTVVSDPFSACSRFSSQEPCLISYDPSGRLFRRDWHLTKRGRLALSSEREIWASPVPVTDPMASRNVLQSLQFQAQRFASHHDAQTVRVWELAHPDKPLHELKHNRQFGAHQSLRLSPDGNVLLAFSQQGSIVWDLKETPPREYPLGLGAYLQDAFFTADNQRLFVADHAGVGIYDWATNREVRRLTYPGHVIQIVPHPDGQHLFTVNHNGTVYILRLPELAEHPQPNP